ncbi:MYND finger [Coniella lustricola]|uniref:MYND-type zinc finger protein samB n=1 Tax=Coniella lustricola TaxID=2025994 RepID=A0A2T3AL93_9PEZI|nr:MYND finger [Coniella lustricola]
MREVNFCIPHVNKASVAITTALYDRRALDSTSTLPLINSLNHLAYLTTSSARIRDILTVDGGIERLVCILKQGRSKDMMDMWKWNLAFQCVVNIGVRGTEVVRTRVVEADMVPVLATILDNYSKVTDKLREKEEKKKQQRDHTHRSRGHDHNGISKTGSFSNRTGRSDIDSRLLRRPAPPPIEVPVVDSPAAASSSTEPGSTFSMTDGSSIPSAETSNQTSTTSVVPPRHPLTSPENSNSFHLHRHQHNHHRDRDMRGFTVTPPPRQLLQPLAQTAAGADADGFIRPVRDVDRLASMGPFGQPQLTSQPTSPTTPLPLPQMRSPTVRPSSGLAQASRSRRRPSIRQQHSTTESDDLNGDSMQSDEAPEAEIAGPADVQEVGIEDIAMEEGDGIITGAQIDLDAPNGSEAPEPGTFNITHRTPIDGSIIAPPPAVTTGPLMGLSPNRPAMVTPPQPTMPSANVPHYLLGRQMSPNPQMLAAMPREEDVLMSLQLLAYVSKYCNLRTYFQKSHLVPRLKIGQELAGLDSEDAHMDIDEDEEFEEEFLLPNDLNIFPMVEKFTVRYHSTDMQYWAGVVMRNLCRKDDTRGGIRQCAYYQCGKWEKFTRQFAKCRRCRRTKYCSKECQKSAWAFHRHWCVAATQS